jgi:hypothetical protein
LFDAMPSLLYVSDLGLALALVAVGALAFRAGMNGSRTARSHFNAGQSDQWGDGDAGGCTAVVVGAVPRWHRSGRNWNNDRTIGPFEPWSVVSQVRPERAKGSSEKGPAAACTGAAANPATASNACKRRMDTSFVDSD